MSKNKNQNRWSRGSQTKEWGFIELHLCVNIFGTIYVLFHLFLKKLPSDEHHPFQFVKGDIEPEMNLLDPTEQPVVTYVGFK